MPNWKWLQSKWAGLLIVAALFVLMAALSWRKWADIVVDFGMQLYVPWRLSEGDVLYRDVMYLPGGPFSQYFNALLFKMFGVSYRTLIFANLAITAAMLVLIYRQFLRATDRWTATTICSAIVMAFAFSFYTDGNYNYVSPYCHDILHGLALSVFAIVFLSNWMEQKRWSFAFGAGCCYGAIFLTKPEIFLALSMTVAATIVLSRRESFPALKSLAAFLMAATVFPLLFFLYFLRLENIRNSLASVCQAWLPVLESSVTKDYFYRHGMGLDHPLANAAWMAAEFFLLAALTIFYALLFRRKIISSRDRMTLLIVSVPMLAVASYMNWIEIGQVLPLTALTLCVLLFFCGKNWLTEKQRVFPLLWSIFALVLLLKMGLNSRLWHYGFALAMPAFVGMIYLLHWMVPWWLQKHGVNYSAFRRLIWWVLIFGCVQLSMQSVLHYVKINYPVGQGGDIIKTTDTNLDQRGLVIAVALSWMQTNLPPHATLAVLPEGAGINYLTRRINPSGYPVWLPPEIEAFGQTNMVAAFEQHQPDYILLLHRPVREYDLNYFGQQPEYGLALMQWIRQNYEVIFQEGAVPLQSTEFGLQILKHKGANPAVP